MFKHINRNRISISFLLILLIISILGGCGEDRLSNKLNSFVDSQGRIIEYEFNELPDGIYAQSHGYETYHKLFTLGIEGYTGMAQEDNNTRYIWWSETDAKYDYDEIIPRLYKGDKLIVKFNSTNSIPASIVLERYNDLGYTIGAHFYEDTSVDETGNPRYYFNGSDNGDWCKASAFAKGISTLGLTNHVVLRSINGKPCNSIKLNRHINMLQNLDRDAAYEFEFYSGTWHQDYAIPADTRYMQSDRVIRLSDPYKETLDGYFVINLPSDMPSGYYYIQDSGLIYYETEQSAWEHPVEYSIEYDLSGGIGNTSGISKYTSNMEDIPVSQLMQAPTKEGYIFAGWYTYSSDSVLGPEDIAVYAGSIGNKTFIAKWVADDTPKQIEVST